MKDSDRALNLTKCFNIGEGFTSSDDTLPDRFFEELAFGKRKGSKLDRKQFDAALKLYYEMIGWDPNTGIPSDGKLHELDLGWANPSSS